MSSLKLSIPHDLSREEALTRIKNLFSKLRVEQKDKISNVTESWENETGKFEFSVSGFNLKGVINVQPSTIDIDAQVPMAVSLFAGKIKQVIEKEAKELLK